MCTAYMYLRENIISFPSEKKKGKKEQHKRKIGSDFCYSIVMQEWLLLTTFQVFLQAQ